MIEYLFLFIVLALIAEILGTVGGFGSSVFFVPMASFFLDFQSVLGVTAVFHLGSNLIKIGAFRKGLDKKLVMSVGIPAIILVSIGAYASQFFDPRSLEIWLGVFLISLSLLFLLLRNIRIQPTTFNGVLGGSLSGFLAGILGTGGAIRGLTLAAFGVAKDSFIATSAVIDLGIDLSRTVVYFNNGYIHKDDLYLFPILLIVSLVGTLIGKKILNHVSQERFRTITLGLIFMIGIATVAKLLWFEFY